MDFDEHDDPEEEIGGMSVQESPYDDSPSPPPLGNSSASRAGLPHNGAGNISKMGGPGEPGSATVGQQQNQLGSMSGGGSSHNRSKPPGSGSASAGGKYKECLKNHAVGIGGHAVDGCGEFLPAGEEGTLDALRCAACNCHRNFHRRELDPGTIPPLALLDLGGGSSGSAAYHHAAAAAAHHYPSPAAAYYPRTPGSAGGGYLHHPQAQQPALHYHHPHFQSSGGRPLALPSTSGGGGSRDEQEGDMLQAMSGGGGGSSGMMMMMGMSGSGSGSGKNKRFRTKFSQEQKDKMLAFSERLGWRIQKHDEAAVQEFCAETGIKRHVLKVWMHNNKHTLGKKP